MGSTLATRFRFLAAGATLALAATAFFPAAAQTAGDDSTEVEDPKARPETEAPETQPEAETAETEAAETEHPNPCVDAEAQVGWIDKIERGIERSVCATAFWFDGFFGDSRYDQEIERPHGWLSIEPVWNEFDGLETRVDFRATMNLPNLDRRVAAFFGRDDSDEVVEGLDERTETTPQFAKSFDEDRELFLGLGYRARRDPRRKIDYRVGVKLGFPMNPFVQGRFRRLHPIDDRSLLRFRETAFWEGEDGFGLTTTADYERVLTDDLLVRWANTGTFSEKSLGVELRSGLILFQRLPGRRAMAYELRFEGESDAPVPTRDYGFRVTYRESVLREWLFGEIVGGLSWPREQLDQDRDAVWVVGVGVEIFFGKPP